MAGLGENDVGTLLQCLKDSLSSNSELQKRSEATLKSLEGVPGFCACLAEIIGNRQADHSARWLASVQFKNTIQRHWKPRGGISDAEKTYLRVKVLGLLEQQDSKIAVQVAVAVAKIARADYPVHWPTMLSDILQKLHGDNTTVSRRVYLVIHHVLKELASKRLAADQKAFAEVTTQLFDLYWHQWCTDTQSLLAGLPEACQAVTTSNPAIVLCFERWLLELKAVRRMLVAGFRSDGTSLEPVPQVLEVIPIMFQALQQLLPLRVKKSTARTQPQAMLDRGIIKLTKSLTNILVVHPWAMYRASLYPLMEFLCTQIVSAERDVPSFDRFLMECMLFVTEAMSIKPYRGVYDALGVGPAARAQAEEVRSRGQEVKESMTAFWAAGRATHLALSLMERFLQTTERELDDWEEMPEQFQHQAMDPVAYTESLRSCAENLFSTILMDYTDQVGPMVLHWLKEVQHMPAVNGGAQDSGPALQAILKKEAVYNAVSVGQYGLQDSINWTDWLRTTLLKEVKDTSPIFKPVRRRILLLFGIWAAALAEEDRPAVYQALAEGLADDDLVIQLSALYSLHIIADDWDFAPGPFLPFAQTFIDCLAALLQQSIEYETHAKVFSLINIMVERLGEQIKPHAGRLLLLVIDAYRDAKTQAMLRITLLTTLQLLVNALGTDSPVLYPMLVPVLRSCTDVNQADALNLLEDGLQLWLVTLRNAPVPNAQLLELFPALASIVETSTEHALMVTHIMASCILSGGSDFLQHYGQMLVAMMLQMMSSLNEQGLALLFPVCEVILHMFPEHGAALLEPCLQRLYLMFIMGEARNPIPTGIFAVFARLFVQATSYLPGFFERLVPLIPGNVLQRQPGGSPSEQALMAYVELWLANFDRMGGRGARKLSALALCSLLGASFPAYLSCFPEVMAVVTGVCFEAEGLDSEALGVSLSVYDYFSSASSTEDDHRVSNAVMMSEDAEGEGTRRRILLESDPVNRVKISDVLSTMLEGGHRAHGAAFVGVMQALDSTLVEQVKLAIGTTP